MKNQESKKLVKELTLKLKQIKDEEITIAKNTINRKSKIEEKYVSLSNYKELIALYNLIKIDVVFYAQKYEDMIVENSKKFPFLFKCNQSIYDFVSELKYGGPLHIAKEMNRQGREIDYINENYGKSEIKK